MLTRTILIGLAASCSIALAMCFYERGHIGEFLENAVLAAPIVGMLFVVVPLARRMVSDRGQPRT